MTSMVLDQQNDPLQWTRYYGDTGDDIIWSILKTNDEKYLLGGYTDSFGSGGHDYWLVKIDSLGDTIWSRTYGGSGEDRSFAIAETVGGGYAMTGETTSYGNGPSDIWLVKTDTNGYTIFTRTYGGDYDDQGVSLLSLDDNGFLVVGSTGKNDPNEGASYDVFVIRTDSLGDTLWTCTIGGSSDDMGWSAVQTLDNGYLVAAMTKSYSSGDAGRSDIWLIKINDYGEVLWTRTYGGEDSDRAYHILQSLDNNFVLVGWSDSYGAESEDGLIMKLDGTGEILWRRTFGGLNDDAFWYSIATPDSGIIVTGAYNPDGSEDWADGWILKVDSNGDSLWSAHYSGHGIDLSNALVPGISEGYVLAGWSHLLDNSVSDGWIVKCDSLGYTQPAVSIKSHPNMSSTFNLKCYPNPFNMSVRLKYAIDVSEDIRISIFDLRGRIVVDRLIKNSATGDHTFEWDAKNDKELELSTGVYVLRLSGGSHSEFQKIVLIK